MYTNTIIAEPIAQAFNQQVMSQRAAMAASSARLAGFHAYALSVIGAGTSVRDAAVAGVGGDAKAQRLAPWARPRLGDELGGGVAVVKQAGARTAIGEASCLTSGVEVTTLSTFGLFNPQHYRDFRTWSPPN